ncbi:fasciclin domain-containing protein [Sphingomicrobium aestuariivivum]|uniref:fasciclin domain-containing protein n=1 Tax=Sphingomicrobium aestuariivivum TaxID=1582356 RepID=UPI001FD711DF|nr:fasciclin domain-containing protein [Sphingomicrobium aestuariivivum]MCJ8190503.1 fasciclin domain-containing protein [Sphingomicrobium aestuariivivum]
MKLAPLAAIAATSLALATPAAAQSADGIDNRPDIVDAASGAPELFSTLVGLVVDAGLVEALQANGPLTVFAPTNDAFAGASLDDDVTSILTYHVVAGRYTSGRVIAAAKKSPGGVDLETLQGNTINIRLANGEVILTDQDGEEHGLVATDINTSNGVIHAIDGVLDPTAD